VGLDELRKQNMQIGLPDLQFCFTGFVQVRRIGGGHKCHAICLWSLHVAQVGSRYHPPHLAPRGYGIDTHMCIVAGRFIKSAS